MLPLLQWIGQQLLQAAVGMREHRQRQHEQRFQIEGIGGQHGEVETVAAR